MKLVWTEDLGVGIGELDRDHKHLIKMINDLQLAIETASGTGTLEKEKTGLAMERLKAHMLAHFEREELYFFQTGYPCQESHRQEHVEIILKIAQSVARFQAGTDPEDGVRIMQSICDWATGHFYVTDRKYGAHFKRGRVGESVPVNSPLLSQASIRQSRKGPESRP